MPLTCHKTATEQQPVKTMREKKDPLASPSHQTWLHIHMTTSLIQIYTKVEILCLMLLEKQWKAQ